MSQKLGKVGISQMISLAWSIQSCQQLHAISKRSFHVWPLAGGSLVWENSNFGGKWRSLAISATTGNFLDPEDLGYQITYRHPDFKGEKDPKRTELSANIFNTRNTSAVFTGQDFLFPRPSSPLDFPYTAELPQDFL